MCRFFFNSFFPYPALEERLSKQHREVESERQLLQTLVGRLEAHLIQQSRTAETERWNLQQETARLRAGEQALEVERTEFLARMEEQRRALAESKVRRSNALKTRSSSTLVCLQY